MTVENPRHDQRGASAIEYCLMILLIALALAAVLGLVGAQIDNMMTQAATALN